MRWYASLRRAGEIAYVRRAGRHAGTATVAIHAIGARMPRASVAVSVSKAVGNAVERNLVKRRIKGALDALPAPAEPLRLLIVARPPAARVGYGPLAADVRSALARLVRL